MIGKYFKSKETDLVVKALTQCTAGTFKGEVIIGDSLNKKGDIYDGWYFDGFKPHESPKPEQSPTKEVELRLECLKLAVEQNNGRALEPKEIITDAQYYYDWVKRKIGYGSLLLLFILAIPFGYLFCAIGRIFISDTYY